MLKIKETLGEDAVILSTRRINGEIEVLAASDLSIDEEPRKRIDLIETVKEAPPPPSTREPEGNIEKILIELEELKKITAASLEKDKQIRELKRELEVIKGILEGGIFGMISIDQEVLPLYNRLKSMEIDEKILSFVLKKISEEELLSPYAVCEEVLRGIVKTSRFSPLPGVPVLFCGPTGVGKTTTLAKVASIMKFYENREVAIISIDTFRIGAADQLKIYADILEIEMFTANTPKEFEQFVALLSDRILLVDTAGRSPKDSLRKEEMQAFIENITEYTLLITIPYGSRTKEAMKVIESFSTKRPDGIILTKFDETEIYGLPINLCWYTGIPIVYITTGQRVPEDIEEASADFIVKHIIEGATE